MARTLYHAPTSLSTHELKKKILNKLNRRVRAAAIMTATLSITKIRKNHHSGHRPRLILGQPALNEDFRAADPKCRASLQC